MNCTDCEFACRIKDEKPGAIRYEDTPCATCKLSEDSSHVMAFDEARDAAPAITPEGSDDGPVMLPLSVLAEALRGFLELPPRVFRAVQLRFKGVSYALIAKELNVTPQAVEVQLKRALEAHPHLKHLLPEKAARHEARKRKRISMARRGKTGTCSN